MNRNTRIGVLAGALVVLVAAFVLLSPGDDKKSPEPAATTATIVATTTTPAGTVKTTQTTVTKKAKPDPGPLLTARKVTKFSVDSGDTVRFRVRSGTDEEVHIHGYDLLREVPAGETVDVKFKASIEGRFEIEFERSATPIGELSVEP